MGWRMVVILSTAWTLSATSVGAAPECRVPGHDGPPKVLFLHHMADPVYLVEKSTQELSAEGGLAGTNNRELGLTTWRTWLRLRPHIWIQPMGDGRACAVLQSVEMDWHLDPIRVDISMDYAKKGCPYRVIKAHENKHVALTKQAFQRFLPKVESAARRAAAQISAIVIAGRTDAEEEFGRRLRPLINPAINDYTKEATRLNAQIDTPQAYAATHRQCTDW